MGIRVVMLVGLFTLMTGRVRTVVFWPCLWFSACWYIARRLFFMQCFPRRSVAVRAHVVFMFLVSGRGHSRFYADWYIVIPACSTISRGMLDPSFGCMKPVLSGMEVSKTPWIPVWDFIASAFRVFLIAVLSAD